MLPADSPHPKAAAASRSADIWHQQILTHPKPATLSTKTELLSAHAELLE